MTTVEIHKEVGVALPDVRQVYAYPYEEMEVGDSFVVPVDSRRRVLTANYRAGKRLGMAFTMKTEGQYVRVWRVR